MIVARIFVSSGLLFAAASSSGFESDVHFGLTQWLALQAGFDEESAKTIAVGDQRVESGDMQYVGPVLAYACVAKDDLRSRLAGEHHYPSAGTVPGAPLTRAVVPDGDAAKKAAREVDRAEAQAWSIQMEGYGARRSARQRSGNASTADCAGLRSNAIAARPAPVSCSMLSVARATRRYGN